MTDNMINGTPGEDNEENSAPDFAAFLRELLARKRDEDDAGDNDEDNYDEEDDDEDEDAPRFPYRPRVSIHEDDDDEDDDEDDELSGMDSDDFHNKAVDLARSSRYDEAVRMCQAGLKRFPEEIDLLADTVKYASKAGDMDTAEAHFQKMLAIPRQRWNWRAYTFGFDYLVLHPLQNEALCRELIADYKRYIPYEEKSHMSESELEEALGNGERSMEVLLHVVDEHPTAPQCALRLADMQMDRGMFGEVIKTCNYGLSASCEVQPSINIPYLILLRTLCKDALLFKRMHQGMHVTADEIDMLVKEYEFIRAEFPELSHYSAITRIRANCLKLQKLSCA